MLPDGVTYEADALIAEYALRFAPEVFSGALWPEVVAISRRAPSLAQQTTEIDQGLGAFSHRTAGSLTWVFLVSL